MALPSSRAFDHVLVIMFENQYRTYVLRNPYMRKLARQGLDLTNFFGVMHPSQTNYIASIAGELCNVTFDGHIRPLLPQRTIVDLLEEAPGPLRWRAYMESYIPQAQPWTPDLLPADASPYYVRHNPFASFASIVQNQARWRHIENESALFSDLLNGTFPEYAWFTPNIWNDGHYLDGLHQEAKPRAPGLVDQLARWLEGFFERLRFPGPRSHLPPRTLVVVTFDEADYEATWEEDNASPYDGPNQAYTVLLGDTIRPGVEEEGYNHYSLLRTIEVNFGLGSLGKNDASANYFQFLWGRRFRWGAPSATPIRGTNALAAAELAGALHIVYAGEDGLAARAHYPRGRRRVRGAGVRGGNEAHARMAGGGRLAAIEDMGGRRLCADGPGRGFQDRRRPDPRRARRLALPHLQDARLGPDERRFVQHGALQRAGAGAQRTLREASKRHDDQHLVAERVPRGPFLDPPRPADPRRARAVHEGLFGARAARDRDARRGLAPRARGRLQPGAPHSSAITPTPLTKHR